MHRKYIALTLPLLFLFSQASVDAQIVRFGPGGGVNVRAPFVRVNVDPYGNASVRAPFVNINPNYGPVYPQPRYQPYPNRFGQPVYPNGTQPGQYRPNSSRIVPNGTYNPNVRVVGPNTSAPGPIPTNPRSNVQPNTIGNQPGNVSNKQPTKPNLVQPSNNSPNPAQPKNSTANRPKPNTPSKDGTFSVLDGDKNSPETKVVAPSVPRPEPLGRYRQMSYRELRQSAIASATKLDRELNQFIDGPKWKRQLRGGTIRDYLAEDTDKALDSDAIKTLRPIVDYFDAVNRDAEKQAISRLPSFQSLRQVLAELMLPPVSRQQKILAYNGENLIAALGRFTTGGSWRKFLKLPESVYSTDQDATQKLAGDLANLKKVLVKYDKAKKNPDYKLVTQLPEFDATHQGLKTMVRLLDNGSSSTEELPSSVANQKTKPAAQPKSVIKKK